tara:strand:- start:106 stop:549 length:444 start_codon:yes stop_codon:yes gene_type:complete
MNFRLLFGIFCLLSYGLIVSSFFNVAFADAVLGEKSFRKCKSCHMIKTEDGVFIQKGGKTGPNLWKLNGRLLGSTTYRYGKSLIAVGKTGLVWNQENFIEYVANPKAFLTSRLNDRSAKSKMSYRLKKKSDASNIWAYLNSVVKNNN